MSIFDRFENAVERGVNNTFSRVFRSGTKPADVNSTIRRSMNDSAGELSPERTIVANHFVVYATCSNFASLEADLEIPADEFALQATEHTTANGHALLDPVHIDFAMDDIKQTGQLRVESSNRRGPAASTTTSPPSPAHPIVDVDGEKWLLTEPVTVIGRDAETDTIVNDSDVSRRHLELRITPMGVITTDLDSTSDTLVKGHRIDATTLLDGNRIAIGRIPIDFWAHPNSDGDQWLQILRSPFSGSLF